MMVTIFNIYLYSGLKNVTIKIVIFHQRILIFVVSYEGRIW